MSVRIVLCVLIPEGSDEREDCALRAYVLREAMDVWIALCALRPEGSDEREDCALRANVLREAMSVRIVLCALMSLGKRWTSRLRFARYRMRPWNGHHLTRKAGFPMAAKTPLVSPR